MTKVKKEDKAKTAIELLLAKVNNSDAVAEYRGGSEYVIHCNESDPNVAVRMAFSSLMRTAGVTETNESIAVADTIEKIQGMLSDGTAKDSGVISRYMLKIISIQSYIISSSNQFVQGIGASNAVFFSRMVN